MTPDSLFSPTAGLKKKPVKRRSFSRVPAPDRFSAAFLLLTAFTALITGCGLFPSAENRESAVPADRPESISAERAEKRAHEKEFICLIALSGAPFCERNGNGGLQGVEPDIIRALAKDLHWKVRLIGVKKESLSAHFRNGYGDIAAGALDTDAIRILGFTPVLAYAPHPPKFASSSLSDFAFLIRSDDSQWLQILTDARKRIDLKKILVPYAGKLPAVPLPAPAAPPAARPPAGSVEKVSGPDGKLIPAKGKEMP